MFSCEYFEIFKNSFFYRTLLVTASVPWTITMLNFNHTFENVRTKDDYSFTNFLSDREMGCPTEGSSYCCLQTTIFRKSFLITFDKYLRKFVSAFHSLVRRLEDYQKCDLRKEPVIAPFVERFKLATLKKSL